MLRNYSSAFVFVLFTSLASAQCAESATNKVLLVGDSWAFFMGVDQTLNTVLERWGHSDARFVTNLVLAENGAQTDDFLEVDKQTEIANQLLDNPSIKVVHLSIGGNDVLGDWNIDMTAQETEALEASVTERLHQVIAFILDIRPDVHVLWSGYMYPNFEEVIESAAPLQTLHPFYGTWEDMGFPSFAQINSVLNNFSAGIAAYIDTMPRVHFVNSPGLLQYTYGQAEALEVAPGGTYAQFTAPLPIGFPEYPSPLNSMRDYGITRDCFHLSPGGYRDMIDLHTRKFYHKFLMNDQYILSNGGQNDGSVSDAGTVSPLLQVGAVGAEQFSSILTFNTTAMESPVVESASIFLRRTSLSGTNPVGSTVSISMKNGAFGATLNVEASDLTDTPDVAGTACRFGANDGNGRWIRLDLPEEFLPFITPANTTQFILSGTESADGVITFTDATDPELAPMLNLTFGEVNTSIITEQLEPTPRIYPNPTEGPVTIAANGHKVRSIRVLDPLGRNVLTFTTNVRSVDLSGLPNGSYTLVLSTETGNEVQRIVKW
ncbi:MAG: T9SS type A sorting domain-containing protein [Flavobacteriales bacterium]|nr:T9SS type A sorting domain-containing protein [Flavobacteriales bacterium]MBP7155054.1 T9SS type A sorting domain-containing protein [Flavobacteriales bacterium]HQV74514.1 T9SS type A sorting domain-containing protein [Flavobacteriales bacterium]HQW40293.1 T9SS type A sorting domain-containing protein [Flavobacteriales bacterium]